jgi:hypothetical protein
VWKCENEELPLKTVSRKGAKTQRGAHLRLPVLVLKLNRKLKVQECDATMVKKEQMPETKSPHPLKGSF